MIRSLVSRLLIYFFAFLAVVIAWIVIILATVWPFSNASITLRCRKLEGICDVSSLRYWRSLYLAVPVLARIDSPIFCHYSVISGLVFFGPFPSVSWLVSHTVMIVRLWFIPASYGRSYWWKFQLIIISVKSLLLNHAIFQPAFQADSHSSYFAVLSFQSRVFRIPVLPCKLCFMKFFS